MAFLSWVIFLYLSTEFNDLSGSFSLSYIVELLIMVLKKVISHVNLTRNRIPSL